MAHTTLRRRAWATRFGAVLVVAVALAGCADDEPSAAPSDASPTSEETAAAGSDEIERDESDEVEGTAEATLEPEPTSDTIPESSDATDDQSTSEQDETNDGATITTTPPATDATGDEPTAEVDGNVAPIPVPGPTVAGDLEDEADFGTGVSASIVEVEAVEVEGRLPGERSGPGVIVTVEVENDSAEAISLDYTTVDLIANTGASAIPVESGLHSRLSGELQPGASALGRYQYYIPDDQRSPVTITISYAAGVPTALFTGALPDA